MEIGQFAEGEVEFEGRRLEPNSRDRPREFRREVLLANEAQERPLWIRVAEDGRSLDDGAIGEFHPDRAPLPHENPANGRTRPDVRPESPSRAGNRIGDRPHPSAHPAPRPLQTSDFGECVVPKDKRGSRGSRSGHRPRDRARGQRRFDFLRLEEIVEQVRN